MANIPFPLTADEIDNLKSQIWELIRVVYEDKIGGADLGDVFAIVGDVLTLSLADSSALTKTGNELAVDVASDGGLEIDSSDQLEIKILSTGGMETDATGLGIKLDGTSLTLSASGLKLTDPLTLGDVTLNNDGLHIEDTDSSHVLTISPGSDLTGNRVLTITTGDSARTVTLSGNPTLSDWFDQSVKQAATPTFANIVCPGNVDGRDVSADGTKLDGVEAGAEVNELEGDGTSGCVLRHIYVAIEDGTNAATLKCYIGSRWNGDAIGSTDNVAKGATTGHFTLSAGGDELTVEAAGLSGNVKMAHGQVSLNMSNTAVTTLCFATGNDIYIKLSDAASGVAQDLTTLVDTGAIYLNVLYLTDA